MEVAILDSCILYSAPLRDFFMRLALKLYQPKWTEAIHEEWIRNVLINRPELTLAQLTRTRKLMDRHGGSCLVKNYEPLIPNLKLPDPNDRHVLAAAIASKANAIVTFNLSDFPSMTLAEYDVVAIHPDDFAVRLFEDTPEMFLKLVKLHRLALINPQRSVGQYQETLLKCGLQKTVKILNARMEEI